MVECVVVGSHLRYDGVWQRPQQIASRLAERVPVLVVEEAFAADVTDERIACAGGVEVLRPLRPRHAYEPDARTVDRVRAWVGTRRAAVWLYTPLMAPLADAFDDATVVYDCMDDLAAFAFAPAGLAEAERALLRRADVVFCGGRSLHETRRSYGAKVVLAPSGVAFDDFARDAAPHPLFAGIARPVYGYAGVIDERMDLEIVRALAREAASVVLVGPVAKIDAAALPRRENVHFTGRQPYDALPSFLAGFDVAIMPFAANAATRSISPTKTPEYLAARRPVVSTPIADVVAAYGDVVTIADGPDAFARACASATRTGPARIARGVALARAAGWDEIVRGMWNLVERE